jgi:hypothetical protein
MPDESRTTTPLRTTIVAMARHHVRPLALLELAAFTVALLLGWTAVALAILAWHVLRMGVLAVQEYRSSRNL